MNDKEMDPQSSSAENCSGSASIGGATSSAGVAMSVSSSSSHEGLPDAVSVGATGASSVAACYQPGPTEAPSVRFLLQRSHAFSGGEENDDNGSMETSTDPRPDNFLQVCARAHACGVRQCSGIPHHLSSVCVSMRVVVSFLHILLFLFLLSPPRYEIHRK